MNLLKTLPIACLFASLISIGHSENLAKFSKPIVGKHNGENLTQLGVPHYNASLGSPSIIIDENSRTVMDTFRAGDTLSHSYFGVIWPGQKITDVRNVSITLGVYGNGGWFGPNRFVPADNTLRINDAISAKTQPVLQVTVDLGKTWKTVRTKSNYLARLNNHKITAPYPNLVDNIVFEPKESISGINGIRIIGFDGGNANADSNGFAAVAEFSVEGDKQPSKLGMPIMGVHSGKNLSTLGKPFCNEIDQSVFNIIDKDLTTSCDTWNGVINETHTFAYAGVVWDKPQIDSITGLEVRLKTFIDGGWFGLNAVSPKPGLALTTRHITTNTIPKVQVTYDKGKTWKTVANDNNYLEQMVGHKIGNVSNFSSVTVKFTLSNPVNSITGIRVIGPAGGGGADKKDKNGFVAISEFEVLSAGTKTVIDTQLEGLVKCVLQDGELSWEVDDETLIKEYRVVNVATRETVLTTPAVQADIYCIDVDNTKALKLQVIDVNGTSHDVNPK